MILELFAAVVLSAAPRAITLEQVREESRSNVDVLKTELEHARAAEQVRVARSSIFPQLSAGTGGLGTMGQTSSEYQSIAQENSFLGAMDLNVSVSQLLYDGGKWWNQIDQAGSSAKAAEGRAEEQRLSAILQGVRRFYDLFRAEKTLEVLEAGAKRSEQQLDRARALFEAGRGQKGDVYAAEVNHGNDRLEIVRQRARIVDAQTKLAAWLGRDGLTPLIAETPAAFDHEAEPLSAITLQEAIAAARSSRPLFQALNAQIRAANLGADVARSGFLPRVVASGTAGRRGIPGDPSFVDPSRQNYVRAGVDLRWDLFNGFITEAQVQQASIQRRLADAELTQAQRELEGELRASVALLQSQLEAVEIARRNVKVATDALALADERFKAGAGSTLEVRDAQLKLTQAELQHLQNRIDVEIARAALERVMGTGTGVNP